MWLVLPILLRVEMLHAATDKLGMAHHAVIVVHIG